ncbi:glycosyltransferase [Gammaproteobacteria bacterium]|nr:glycosyltransferase [Gammaproteobacteria bacterium]
MDKSLSIVILSFNRAEILIENLEALLAQLNGHNIKIYVFDDSNNDEVKQSLENNFFLNDSLGYIRNDPSLGHDLNYVTSLLYPKTDYVWIMGDSTCIYKDTLSEIFTLLQTHNPHLLLINSDGRNIDLPSKKYNDLSNFLGDLGWHSTLTGTCIYSRDVLNKIDMQVILRFKNFPQIASIFYNKIDCPNLYWYKKKLIFNRSYKTSYWSKKPFNVFLDDWSYAVNALPDDYSREVKDMAILNHSVNTKIFSLTSMLKFRMDGALNINILRDKSLLLKTHSSIHLVFLFLLALTPKTILKILFWVKKNSRDQKK